MKADTLRRIMLEQAVLARCEDCFKTRACRVVSRRTTETCTEQVYVCFSCSRKGD